MIKYLSGLFLMASAVPVCAATYICLANGKPVYTTERAGLTACRLSQMDGIAESEPVPFAPPPAVSAAVALPAAASAPAEADRDDDAITRIWQRHEYGGFDDAPILPPLPKPPPAVKPAPAAPAKPRVVRRPVQVRTVPPPPPKRRQVLEEEIRRERAALAVARRELQAARKRGDAATAQRWDGMVRDREQNIRSLTEEWRR